MRDCGFGTAEGVMSDKSLGKSLGLYALRKKFCKNYSNFNKNYYTVE